MRLNPSLMSDSFQARLAAPATARSQYEDDELTLSGGCSGTVKILKIAVLFVLATALLLACVFSIVLYRKYAASRTECFAIYKTP
jgi:hypothetical protein